MVTSPGSDFWDHLVSERMAEATELKFSVPIDSWGPVKNYATVCPMRVWVT